MIGDALDYILGLDISFYEILEYIFVDPNIVELMGNAFKFENDFYNEYRNTMKMDIYRPTIENNIILQLQSHYGNDIDLTP